MDATHIGFIGRPESVQPQHQSSPEQVGPRITRPDCEAGAGDDSPESDGEAPEVARDKPIRYAGLDPFDFHLGFGGGPAELDWSPSGYVPTLDLVRARLILAITEPARCEAHNQNVLSRSDHSLSPLQACHKHKLLRLRPPTGCVCCSRKGM